MSGLRRKMGTLTKDKPGLWYYEIFQSTTYHFDKALVLQFFRLYMFYYVLPLLAQYQWGRQYAFFYSLFAAEEMNSTIIPWE